MNLEIHYLDKLYFRIPSVFGKEIHQQRESDYTACAAVIKDWQLHKRYPPCRQVSFHWSLVTWKQNKISHMKKVFFGGEH